MKFNFTKQTGPTLAERVYEAPPDWKISMLAEMHGGTAMGIYHNKTRRDARILWNHSGITKEIYQGNDETIGHPLVIGPYVIAAGECGNLIAAREGVVFKHYPIKWATTCVLFGGAAYVLDWTGKRLAARDCITGAEAFTMPGGGIAMSAAEYGGYLWAAVTNADNGQNGLSCSSGLFLPAGGCQCVAGFHGRLLFSSWNQIFNVQGAEAHLSGEFPCEKIMDMHVIDGRLRIAGSNPDACWEADEMGQVRLIGVIPNDNAKVGDTCFRVRVSRNYFARARNGTRGEVYRILG